MPRAHAPHAATAATNDNAASPHRAHANSFEQLNAPLCKEACAEGQRKESDACTRAFTFRDAMKAAQCGEN